jgi:hypothetical protein
MILARSGSLGKTDHRSARPPRQTTSAIDQSGDTGALRVGN